MHLRREYKAHGATVVDVYGCFTIGYGVDAGRAQMIADALNAQNGCPHTSAAPADSVQGLVGTQVEATTTEIER